MIFNILFTLSILSAFVFIVFSGIMKPLLYIINLFTSENPTNDLINIDQTRFYLEKNNFYYRKLSPKAKKKFEKRVMRFAEDFDFEGKNGLRITEEMKILISGAAIQLTFGLEKYLFTSYLNIFVYPDSFYSPSLGRKVKGGVALSNIIALSWSDFVKGYEIDNDNFNLGLHEMTHALKCEATFAEGITTSFRKKLTDWLEKSESRMKILEERKTKYIRDYAHVNVEEFFSVCVEYFFESPEEFKLNHSDIYADLCLLLNQDPTNHLGDYRLNSHSSIYTFPDYFKFNFHYDKVEPYLKTIYSFCTLLFLFTLTFTISNLIISTSDLIILSLLLIVLFLPFIRILHLRGFNAVNLIKLLFFCWIPFGLFLILSLNFSSLGEEEFMMGQIKSIHEEDNQVKIEFENNLLNQCLTCGEYTLDNVNIRNLDSISFQYTRGLFNIPLIKSKTFYHHIEKNGVIIRTSFTP